VEIERVDVLVLLRGVLGVLDGAVGPMAEPVRVLAHERMVGGALQRQIQRDLDAMVLRPRDEAPKILRGAELGVDGLMPALRRADGPGAAWVVGAGRGGVVAPFPVA